MYIHMHTYIYIYIYIYIYESVRFKTSADLNNPRMATNSNIKQHMATYSIIQQHIFYIVVSNYYLFLENLKFRRSSAPKGLQIFP